MKKTEMAGQGGECGKGKSGAKKRIAKSKNIVLSKNLMRKTLQQKIEKNRRLVSAQGKSIKAQHLADCVNKQQFTCSICLQLMIYPTTLQCGHTFCLPCVENFNKTIIKNQCSLCRADNSCRFHEIDSIIQKVIQFIRTDKLTQTEIQEYEGRKKNIEKQFQTRGIKNHLKLNDQIKIKVKNYWVKGRVIKIYERGPNTFYQVYTIVSQENHCMSKRSINIRQEEVQKVSKVKRYSNCIFSQNIFLEDPLPRRQIDNNTYNIQQLLWEVSYYEPSQAILPLWGNWQYSPLSTQRDENHHLQNLPFTNFDLNFD